MWMIQSVNKLNNITRYFATFKDYKDYIYVFKDHWCNVVWTDPIKVNIKDVPYLAVKNMEIKSAKQRAEDDLAWGFNASWQDELSDRLTAEQEAYVNFLLKQMGVL